MLSEIGVRNLLDLEDQYCCRVMPDFINKTLKLSAPANIIGEIEKQIKHKLTEEFVYRVNLNTKTFKHFRENPDQYNKLQTNFKLNLIELEEMGQSMLLEGSALNIQGAMNFLTTLIESLSKPE